MLDIYLPPNVEWSGSLQPEQPGGGGGAGSSAAGTAPANAAATAAAAAAAAGDSGAAAAAAAGGSQGGGAPVVLFCHGGVWASGAGWHYAPLATRLAQAGVVTAVMQYSLFPDALVPQMVAEVGAGGQWLGRARGPAGCLRLQRLRLGGCWMGARRRLAASSVGC